MMMKAPILCTIVAICLATPTFAADEKPATGKPAAEKKDEKADEKKGEKDTEKNKKDAEAMLKRLKDDAKKKLWDVVTKGSDDDLKAAKLTPEKIEALKEARPNLKAWEDILATESLGRDVLKDLVDYGASAKFTKDIDDEKKAKDKAEKDRERDKKKARKDREADKKPGT
jgi:hypothetical protein